MNQLAKQLSDLLSNTFSANTNNNPKENYNFSLTDDKNVVKANQGEAEESEGKRVYDEACQEEFKDLPKKEADIGVGILLVSVGNMEIGNTLIDLGISFNIMSLSMVDRINICE